MQDAQYITRSDLDTALAKFRDETLSLVAEKLQHAGGNGQPPPATRASAADQTRESDAALILQSIAALKDEVTQGHSEVQSEIRELKADVGELKADVGELKADVGELKIETAVVKTEQASIRKEVASTAKEIRAELKAECEAVRGEVRELRGETRMVKWGLGLVVGAMLTGLTIVHQDLGRRLDSVRTELHSSVGGLRGEVGELRDAFTEALERLVRLETRESMAPRPD